MERGTIAEARRQIVVIFLGLALAMFLASLDQTIVVTTLPVIAGDLGGLDHLTWIIIAYHLTSASTMPLWGRASDLYGRKKLLISAILTFLLGSALCGVAGTLSELIAFRACQGIGGGGMITLAMAVIADVVPPRERGRYQGYIQLLFTLSSVVGPLLGGLLADALSWRWVFYVNLPVGAAALAILLTQLQLPATRTDRTVDYLGAALLVSSVACLLLVTGQHIWSLALAGAVLLAAFVWRERRAAEPIMPPRLFRRPVFVVVAVALFLTTCTLFAVLIFTPLFLQRVVGASATGSGLLLLPMTVGITLSTVLSGRMKTGRYQHFPAIGLTIVTVAVFLLSRLSAGSSQSTVTLDMLLFGIGFGLVTQVLVVATQNDADRADIGIVTASANFFRALGGSIGAAVFGAVFAGALVGGVAHAVDAVFLVAMPVAVLALVTVLFLRKR